MMPQDTEGQIHQLLTGEVFIGIWVCSCECGWRSEHHSIADLAIEEGRRHLRQVTGVST